jgi:hypothetical protein
VRRIQIFMHIRDSTLTTCQVSTFTGKVAHLLTFLK